MEKIKYFLLIAASLLFAFKAFGLTYEVVRSEKCRALGYSSENRQTDHDPFATAGGTKPKWGTVAANHLPIWTRMKIQGFGEKIFVVEDRMNKRYNRMIDIWFPTRKEALKWGSRMVNYSIVKNVRPLPD